MVFGVLWDAKKSLPRTKNPNANEIDVCVSLRGKGDP